MKVLFTFETVSAALDCERLFQELAISCRIIPVPRSLSVSCAYAITAETGDWRGLCEALRQKGAEYGKVFCCEVSPGQGETYKLLDGHESRKNTEARYGERDAYS